MLYLCIFCMCIAKSFGIGIDYYSDDDGVKQNNVSYSIVNASLLLNETIRESFDKNESEYTEVKVFNTANKEIHGIAEAVEILEDKKEFNNSVDFKHRKMFESNQSDVSSFVKPPVNIFKEYEYIYDDEGYYARKNESSDREAKLRSTVNQNKNNGSNLTKKVKQKKLHKIKINTLGYYKLEPAVTNVHLQDDRFVGDDENVWYVPEDLPCWQLPILYGELGYKNKTPGVFSVNRGYLKNVVHERERKKTFPKVTHAPGKQLFNKWCGIEPCYGDHTLCLFPDKTVSTLCGKEYKVKSPTFSEQVALVNTVNSMRNRVAIGETIRYSHLPQAANMMQITYDNDLEKMAVAWLSQCLPGPAPCSALDGNFVSQLECTKYMQQCCINAVKRNYNCTPQAECFVMAVVGCIHIWYWSAGTSISETDVQCGHIESSTFNTVQLIWANTHKIGCAFGVNINGNIRVVCNFSPGAPYFLKPRFYCGILSHKDITDNIETKFDITNLTFLSSLGINLEEVFVIKMKDEHKVYLSTNQTLDYRNISKPLSHWGVDSLSKIYKEGWARRLFDYNKNGTMGMLARVITQYNFFEESQSRCDTEEPVYVIGKPGSLCMEKGRRFPALCYHFRDPTPGYRLVAIIAPITLFSLILYDLFSGAVRQTF